MTTRIPQHGYLLPSFSKQSSIPTLHLDAQREKLDETLEGFVRMMDLIHADRDLSEHGKATKVAALVESTRRQLETLRMQGVAQVETAARMRKSHLEKPPAADDVIGEARRAEVRRYLQSVPASEQFAVAYQAVRDGDLETLQAISEAPAIIARTLLSEQQRTLVRETFQRLRAPDAFAQVEARELIGHQFTHVADEAIKLMERSATADGRAWAQHAQRRASVVSMAEHHARDVAERDTTLAQRRAEYEASPEGRRAAALAAMEAEQAKVTEQLAAQVDRALTSSGSSSTTSA